MRSIIAVLALALLASTVSAGSIRPAAVVTDPTTEDPTIKPFMRWVNGQTCGSLGQPKDCTDAQAKAAFATCANTGLPPTCTPAEAQAAAVAAGRVLPVIYPLTQAGLQDYSSVIYAGMIHDWLKQGAAIKISKQLPEAFLALSPADQAKVIALIPALQ